MELYKEYVFCGRRRDVREERRGCSGVGVELAGGYVDKAREHAFTSFASCPKSIVRPPRESGRDGANLHLFGK